MKLKSTFLRLLLACSLLAAAALPAVAGGGSALSLYLAAKGQHFIQTNDAAPVLDTTGPELAPFRFIANVESTGPGALTAATLRKPNNSVVTLTNEPGDDAFRFEDKLATSNALNSAFPAGAYVFSITTPGGPKTGTVTFPADAYPTTPHILNWSALQSVITNNAIQIQWEPFAGGTTNDFVQFSIESDDGDEIFFSGDVGEPGSLDGTATSVFVPANTFAAGSNYHARLLFARVYPTNSTEIPGATGFSAHYKELTFPIVGATPPPAGGRFQFAESAFAATEDAGLVTVTVQRAGGTQGNVFVDLVTRQGTATPGNDYQETTTQLVWADGEDASKDVMINIADDTNLEGNETFIVYLTNSAPLTEIGLPSQAVVTILDNETAGAGLLQFSAANVMVNESAGKATLIVTRTGGTAGQVSVFYATVPGENGAQAGFDYTERVGFLVFSNGVASRTIEIPIIADQRDESDESFGVLLSTPTGGASLGAVGEATVLIKDDDVAGTFSFSASMYSVSESPTGTNAAVIVRRTGGMATNASVDLVITGGSAVLGEDYAHGGGDSVTLHFGPGQNAVTNLFEIGDDNEPEGDEGITLQLRNPDGGARLVGITNATIKLLDNEVVFQFSSGFYTNKENVAVAIVFVERTGPATGSNGVTIGTGGGSAGPFADYLPTNLFLNFTAGQKRKPVGIRVVNDYLVEENETIGLHLEDPTGGAQLNPLRTDATLFILSEDAGGKIQFAAPIVNVLESRTNVLVTVTRTMGLASNVTVRLRTADRTAAAGLDYRSLETNITFAARQARATVSIPLMPDAIDETNETFDVTLDNAEGGATVGERSAATVVILDNDAGGIIGFARAEYLVNEAIGDANPPSNSVRVVVTRTGGLASNVTVRLTTADGSASAAQPDYAAVDIYLTFAAGEISKTNLITIVNDTLPEAALPETINLHLREYTGGARPGISNAVIRITDDESSVSFTTNMVMGTEGSSVTLTVARAGALGTTVSVGFRTVGGTATQGVDYTGTNGVLTFLPNQPTKTVTVRITGDPQAETNESFAVILENPTGGVQLGAISSVTVAVKDAPDPAAIPLSRAPFLTQTARPVMNTTFSRNLSISPPALGQTMTGSFNAGANSLSITCTKGIAEQEVVELSLYGVTGPGVFNVSRPGNTADVTYSYIAVSGFFGYVSTVVGVGSGTITLDNFNGTKATGRYDLILVDTTDDTKTIRVVGSFSTNVL